MKTGIEITFLPYGKKVRVSKGTNLLKAANLVGIYLNSVCGGNGACGKCVVVIREGDFQTSSELPDAALPDGGRKVLACQTEVMGDVVVEVPRSSVVKEGEEEKILTDSLEFGSPEECPCRAGRDGSGEIGPTLTRKIYLEMSPPTLDDTTADLERFMKSLEQKLEEPPGPIGLAGLRSLSKVLRQGTWSVTATLGAADHLPEVLQVEPGDTRDRHYGLAVDIGTTTVVAELVDMTSCISLGTQASHNQQIGYGEDVISRIVFACNRGGQDTLQESVVETVNQLIEALCRETGVDRRDITAMVAAGNTTMTHLLLGLPPCNIRMEPYIPVVNQYPPVRTGDIGVNINPNGIVFCVPGVSSYVGGDITAGVVYTELAESEDVTLFMDLGTNGEMVLGNRDWLTCCSASVGPAFEGGGIRWGMRATAGAIEKVFFEGPDKQLRYETIGHAKPRGICGSGLIDILGTFLLNGIIDQQGRFMPEKAGERWREVDGAGEYVIAFKDETSVGEDITIAQEDIQNVIRSKAAVFAAATTMLNATGIPFDEIQHVLVAGGFGTFLDIEKAILIGLLPDLPLERFRFVGNSSLKGARRVLLCREFLEKSRQISQAMTYLELSVYPGYMDEYIAAMFLPHTDMAKFPTVREKLS